MAITEFDLDNVFSYYAPQEGQAERWDSIRKAGKELARAILQNTGVGADQRIILAEANPVPTTPFQFGTFLDHETFVIQLLFATIWKPCLRTARGPLITYPSSLRRGRQGGDKRKPPCRFVRHNLRGVTTT